MISGSGGNLENLSAIGFSSRSLYYTILTNNVHPNMIVKIPATVNEITPEKSPLKQSAPRIASGTQPKKLSLAGAATLFRPPVSYVHVAQSRCAVLVGRLGHVKEARARPKKEEKTVVKVGACPEKQRSRSALCPERGNNPLWGAASYDST